VSQRRVQDFLKFYQAQQKITVLLTSHYMKDVEALCQRAVIINEGEIKHDGPLAQIVDRFSTHKVIELQFAGSEIPPDLSRFGEVFDIHAPRAKLRVPRNRIPEILTALLSQYSMEDVSVHDRPLEEAIAEMFTSSRDPAREQEART
jgi:ABC-2 type transport system ATP-binding protein